VKGYGEFASGMSKEERAKLSVSDKQKYCDKATKGLESKFTMLESTTDVGVDKEKPKPLYNVATRIDEYKRQVKAFNMQDVFTIPNEFTEDTKGGLVPAAGAQPIDLFSSYTSIDLEKVKSYSQFVFQNVPGM
jgi:hypothetical protein